MNHLGGGRWTASSAGSHPTGSVHPGTLALLRSKGLRTDGLRSKSWDECAGTSFDIVITVCDGAAGETCPVFLGAPVRAHWGVPDPAHAAGTEEEVAAAFERAYGLLAARIDALLRLPSAGMDERNLAAQLRSIGLTHA